jgi:hypothetical protein
LAGFVTVNAAPPTTLTFDLKIGPVIVKVFRFKIRAGQ